MGNLKHIRRSWENLTNNKPNQGRIVVNKFYQTMLWRKFRLAFKNGHSTHLPGLPTHNNIFCWICMLNGRLTPTHTIDHLLPINPVNSFDIQDGKYGKPLDWNNCGPLCKNHADRKNAIERQYPNMSLGEKIKKLKIVQ